MELINTPIKDLVVLKPKLIFDERGYFFEAYNRFTLNNLGINLDFCQDNCSMSSYGVLRGLHYQLAPYSQAKLVSVIEGKVWDVAVDLRKNSPTFGHWYGTELSGENHLQFLIPRGFAHGFSVLSERAIFIYKIDNTYNPTSERGIIYNDKKLNINWKLNPNDIILAEKDKKLLPFDEIEINF